MFRNKSQMEIMGLVLIVVLIGLGLLFALQYSFKQPTKTVQKTKESILAANFLHSLLNTNTDCRTLQIKEILQACALGKSVECNGQQSCDFAKTKIDELLQKTLKVWGKKYDFRIEGADSTKDIWLPKQGKIVCKGEKESNTYIITVTAEFYLSVILDIC